MPEYRFAVNLRADTAAADFVSGLRPWGWLAAPANTTAATRRFVAAAAGRGRAFVADNGNFAEIGRLAVPHRPEATRLRLRLTALEADLGRTAVRADLEPAMAMAYDDLARAVRLDVAHRSYDDAALLDRQLTLGATHVIGAEDLTAAVLLALDVEPHLLGWPRDRWRAINRAVAIRADRAMATRPAARDRYYAVASAVDWPSAYDAGVEFARAGLPRVAMGFGAYMADDHSVDFVRIDGRTVRLAARVPQRYLRTAVVVSAFFAGYRSVEGTAPAAFHFLGLGAPIMMGVVARAAGDVPLVSFDAMSPIKDAVEGTLYTLRPAFLKIRTRAVAAGMARGRAWSCPCPFCRRFLADYPFDLGTARAWAAAGGTVVGAADLRPGGALYDALPLLSEPPAGPRRRAVTAVRTGHNHWALHRLCARLTARSSPAELGAYVEEVVGAYQRATNSARFGAAVRLGLDIVTGRLR